MKKVVIFVFGQTAVAHISATQNPAVPPFGFDAIDRIGTAQHNGCRETVSALRLDMVYIVGSTNDGDE